MNLEENIENNSDEITIKIRAMDNNFIINIKRDSTIKDLKEKIASVNIIILYNFNYIELSYSCRKAKINISRSCIRRFKINF